MEKHLLSSKTFWFNVLATLVLIATQYGYTPDVLTIPETQTIISGLIPLVNIALRLVTKKAVTL